MKQTVMGVVITAYILNEDETEQRKVEIIVAPYNIPHPILERLLEKALPEVHER